MISQRAGTAEAVLGAVSKGGVASLYAHVPFCFHKCHYCDFYSIVDSRDRQERFTERLIGELRAIAGWAGRLETIFVGGGTPSLLRVELWERLLVALDREFDLSEVRAGRGEFTVECNPETVTPELMAVLRGGGVDRISIGAQSFDPRHLKTLERWHDPENVERAVDRARSAGFSRISVDLIYAIPAQTVEEWTWDLERALLLGTEHVSCYNLTYEPRTAMTARLARGEFAAADEDVEIEMFQAASAMMRARGLERYEVSNYAKKGSESRHNLVYWRCGAWLAAGPSASGHAGGHRWKNVARLEDYLAGDGFAPISEHERPEAARQVRERIMMGVRLAEGLDEAPLLRAAGELRQEWGEGLARAMDRTCEHGLTERAGGRVRLTDAGVLMADGVARDWMREVL